MSETPSNMPTKLPAEPIDRFVAPISRFLHVEAAAGAILVGCTAVTLGLANSPWADAFLGFWKTNVGFSVGAFEFRHSLKHLINDGLMAVFFFVIGLEVKREIVVGELRDMRRAALPIAAAVGGMVLPAALFLTLQLGEAGEAGWGVCMATDIAFVVGCMAVLGSRVPHSLRILLLSLAIVDDIGAILVIAVGYTGGLDWNWLAAALVGIGLVRFFARIGIRSFAIYTVAGVFIWFGFHESGVHATIAGVILGLMTPAKTHVSEGLYTEMLQRAQKVFEGEGWSSVPHRAEKVRAFQRITRETISPLEFLEKTLHPWTGFVIMPIFAMANAGIPIQLDDLRDSLAVAVVLGLAVGKPLGIVGASWLAVKLGLAELPKGVGWRLMFAGGCLAGIGFTMALFIAELAFRSDAELLDTAKIGVFAASAVSALAGMTLLIVLLGRSKPSA